MRARGRITAVLLMAVMVCGYAGNRFLRAAEPLQPKWEKLDQRPVPEWYREAKFGIFVHWGVYSVPAYTRRGGYAEWYWKALQTPDSEARRFHDRVWGQWFRYEDFAGLFRAELYNPDAWADLFRRSGARYAVLTSKHHDGYCLWPTTFRPGWNSGETGPRRDLVGPFMESVRKAGLRAGLYYSLPEWTHPLYRWTVDSPDPGLDHYVQEYMIPQLKELVDHYQPSLLFADGEWDHPASRWHSEELVSWLYNHPAVGSEIVVNDRWGNDTRFRHGTYFATEYSRGLDGQNHPWEECRGLGSSFGYNRNETAADYMPAGDLVRMLVRIVSEGGNLLLNVGPTADGRIPEIMQDRLLSIGRWLDVNGEAIYGTHPWAFRLEGQDVRYTAGKDGKSVYAIALRWPAASFRLRKVRPHPGSQIRLLGVENPLPWKWDSREGLTITVDPALRDRFPDGHAYAFRMEADPSLYTPPPFIGTALHVAGEPEDFIRETRVVLKAGEGEEIRYTLDGTEPGFSSAKYREPVTLSAGATVKAFAIQSGGVRSETVSASFRKVEPLPAQQGTATAAGLKYSYFEGAFADMPECAHLAPARIGTVPVPTLGVKVRETGFAIRFEGFLDAPQEGVYTFFLRSDDGSRLLLDGKEVLSNPGQHDDSKEVRGQVALARGLHTFVLEYLQVDGTASLRLEADGPDTPRGAVPAGWFRN